MKSPDEIRKSAAAARSRLQAAQPATPKPRSRPSPAKPGSRSSKPRKRRQPSARALSARVLEVRAALDPEIREALDREAEGAWARKVMAEGKAAKDYGMVTGAYNCFSCGAFKSRPSAVCGQCGDDPVSHNGDRRQFDRAHGYIGDER